MQYTTGMGTAGGTLLSGWRGALFKEWTFADTITAGSGLPETPVYLAPVPGTGVTGTIRPEYTGAPLYAAPAGFFLNPAAYIAPLPGQWGNAGRDSITGPAQFTLNASLGRTFRVSDRLNLDLRVDSTNALNHVTFTDLEHHREQHAVRIAGRGQCHAQHANDAALEVLTDAAARLPFFYVPQPPPRRSRSAKIRRPEAPEQPRSPPAPS